MAGYAFSHQFYQRWTQAPGQVRGAIVQELKDIMTLLQTDTTVAEFAFTQPDLNGYLDELYTQDSIQKAADAEKIRIAQEQERIEREALEAQRQEEERLAKEQLEQEQLEQERLEIARLEEEAKQEAYEKAELQREQQQAEQAEAEQQAVQAEAEQQAALTSDHKSEEAGTSKTAAKADTEHTATLTIVPQLDEEVAATTAQPATTPASAVSPDQQGDCVPAEFVKLSAEQEDFIHELEVRIDDYLSEQMADMSENLKAWLRDEVQRQLARAK